MAPLLIIIISQILTAQSAFFDITDVDDPLALLWHTKDSLISPKDKECTVQLSDNSTLSGLCKHKTHCYLSGGNVQHHGSCGILQTCCTYQRSCQKNTKSRVSYFTSGSTPPSECDFIVDIANENICQIRLDFEIFRLAPSTLTTIDGANQAYKCNFDALTIYPDTYNVPKFCGYNDGQHVYIHLEHEKKIRLSMHLADRAITPLDPNGNIIQLPQNPQWRIKVTQLECPGKQDFFAKHKNWNAIDDFDWLAPKGAIQHFIEKSGRFRSFGFDGSLGDYQNGLMYVASFKKRPGTCLRFMTSTAFNVRKTTITGCTDNDDYLYVPELNIEQSNQLGPLDSKSVICGTVDNGNTPAIFTSKTPGPFYVEFVSQPTIQNQISPIDVSPFAFDLLYEIYKCS